MAAKTITIDMDAYELLSRHKKAGQSFSHVIKEHFGGMRTIRDFRKVAGSVSVSEPALDAIDSRIKARRSDKAKPIKL